MLIAPLINQSGGGGLDMIWILLPLLCCVMMMSQRREERPSVSGIVSESWYTTQSIETTYDEIEKITADWRRETEAIKETSKSFVSTLRGVLGGRRSVERFVERERVTPRLLRLADSTGPVIFELTEVEGGGTVVKASYSQSIQGRMVKFKAGLPLKIPAAPIGNKCPSCGKSVLSEFVLCPYCGDKLIRE